MPFPHDSEPRLSGEQTTEAFRTHRSQRRVLFSNSAVVSNLIKGCVVETSDVLYIPYHYR